MTAIHRYLPAVLPVLPMPLVWRDVSILLLSEEEAMRSLVDTALKGNHCFLSYAGKSSQDLQRVTYNLTRFHRVKLVIVMHESIEYVSAQIKFLRQHYPWLAILAVFPEDNLQKRLSAYKSGADLCLTLPIESEELNAVINSLIGRVMIPSSAMPQLPCLNLDSGELSYQGHTMLLHRPELDFLHGLATAPNYFLSSHQVLDLLGHPDDFYGKKRVHVMVSRMRSRMGEQLAGLNLVNAKRAQGYTLAVPLNITVCRYTTAICEELVKCVA